MKNFYLKQAVFSFADSFKVFNANQQVAYHARAKLLSLDRQYLIHRGTDDRLLFTMKRRMFSFMPHYELHDPAGHRVASMAKRFAFLKNAIDIESEGRQYVLEGSIWAHDFTLTCDGQIALSVQKRMLAWGDTYELQVADNADCDKMIAFAIMIDSIYHRKKN